MPAERERSRVNLAPPLPSARPTPSARRERPNWYSTDGVKRQTLTIPEAARVLGIGRATGYEMARTGQLPTIRFGRRVLVPVPALEAILGGPVAFIDDRADDDH